MLYQAEPCSLKAGPVPVFPLPRPNYLSQNQESNPRPPTPEADSLQAPRHV